MDKKIEYSTISEQIELLRSKDLIIDDVDFASEQLKQFGYYNIINSYKVPYQRTLMVKKFLYQEPPSIRFFLYLLLTTRSEMLLCHLC